MVEAFRDEEAAARARVEAVRGELVEAEAELAALAQRVPTSPRASSALVPKAPPSVWHVGRLRYRGRPLFAAFRELTAGEVSTILLPLVLAPIVLALLLALVFDLLAVPFLLLANLRWRGGAMETLADERGRHVRIAETTPEVATANGENESSHVEEVRASDAEAIRRT